MLPFSTKQKEVTMTKSNYTHLTLVVDRSGSMDSMRADAQGGINTLIAEQFAEDGQLSITLVEFDTTIDTVTRMSATAPTYELVPRGMTALLDAVGSEIVRTGQDLSNLAEDEKPEQVLFVVVTDGDENSSLEYDLDAVRALITQQKDQYQWIFQFLGAADSAWQGRDMGMNASAFTGTAVGQRTAYRLLNDEMKEVRRTKKARFEMPDVMPEQVDDEGQSA